MLTFYLKKIKLLFNDFQQKFGTLFTKKNVSKTVICYNHWHSVLMSNFGINSTKEIISA